MTIKKPTAKPATKKTAAKATPKKAAAVKVPVKKPVAKKAAAKPVAKAVTKAVVKATSKATAKTVAKKPAVALKAAPKTPLKKAAVKPAPKKAVSKKSVAPKVTKPIDEMERLAKFISKTLDTNKAEDIVAIPLAGRSSLADWMIIASGKSARQVGALANYVQRAFTEQGYKRLRTEGMPQGDWVVIDSGDVVVHLFRPEVREFYQLEKLWAEEPGEPTQTKTLR